MKTVLSGIQPTGNLHIGNYLGSIKNWLDLQHQHNCLFGIMNLHAITLPQDPKELSDNVFDAACIYLACGLDADKTTIFVQSEVPQIAEIAWVLGCMTPMGWLNRMTQFKDKTRSKTEVNGVIEYTGFDDEYRQNLSKKYNDLAQNFNLDLLTTKENYEESKKYLQDNADKTIKALRILQEIKFLEKDEENRSAKANLGLYAYPVLMASDILTFRADLVPVGHDQKQHLELARDLAGAFNRKVGRDYFKLPEPLIMAQTKRIMSLQDGAKKMSKSDESDLSRINLNDSAEEIVKKIKKAKTDSQSEITYDEARGEIYNLLNIFASFANKDPRDIAKEYQSAGYGKFKGDLAEIIVEKMRVVKYSLDSFKNDRSQVEDILKRGAQKAREISSKNKSEIFKMMGLR